MKFKYKDKIMVISGFYEGWKGTIEEELDKYPPAEKFDRYTVKLSNGAYVTIKEINIEHWRQ